MLPFDNRPWAKNVAVFVIVCTVAATLVYALAVTHHRKLDTGEKAILLLLLLTVVPPNVAIIQRHGRVVR